MDKRILHILNRLFDIVGWLCVVACVYLIFQVFVCSTFKVPSGSMEPTIETGDNVVINKLAYGPRLFNVTDTVKCGSVYRLPGFSSIKRNDVIVFNNTMANSKVRDRYTFNVLKYYIKRCVALPGDTFSIRDCHYYVAGCNEPLGNVAAQNRLQGIVERVWNNPDYYRYMRAYPKQRMFKWTIADMGPLYVPRKGDTIALSDSAAVLYGRCINWETGDTLVQKDGQYMLGDSAITSYTFRENYYMACGDNAPDSQDSRYWGFIPEEFIAGRAMMVWLNHDTERDEYRWNRVGTLIK